MGIDPTRKQSPTVTLLSPLKAPRKEDNSRLTRQEDRSRQSGSTAMGKQA